MRRTGLLALAFLLPGTPQAVLAQTSDSPAYASLEAYMTGTTVRESASGFAGAAGLLSLGTRFSFGAAGGLMLGSSTLEADGTGSDLDLHLAYGGLLLQARLVGTRDHFLALRALFGAGNAKIELPVVGSEVAADNFGVLEPEVVGMVKVLGPLQLGVGAGYRHVFGVNDLPNVAPADLTGFLARVRLSIRTD